MRLELLNAMPSELYNLMSEGPLPVDTMRHRFANRTAARFSDLDRIVLTLARENEIDILSSEGK